MEALAEPVADERFAVLVLTECAAGDGGTRVEVSLALLSDQDLTLDYVLTDDDGITRTGTVTLTAEDEGAEFGVAGLPVGSYHLDFLPDGGGEPLTVQNFEILTCLVTAVQCEQITFLNPISNPTVGFTYGEGSADEDDYQDFELQPGERRLFRTDRGVIHWLAGTVEGGAGDNLSIAYAGVEDEVSIPSDCEPAPPRAEPAEGPAGPDQGLANTGGSADTVGALVGGSVLVAVGASTLLLRRRRI